jgi:hypothetical protein
MKLLIAGLAGLAAALMAVSAQAQVNPGQQSQMTGASRIGQNASNAGHATDEPKYKANDKAYNAALRNLPDKQYDPWHGVR